MKVGDIIARAKSTSGIGKKQRAKKETDPTADDLILCTCCGKQVKKRNFYKSYNPNHKLGIVPFCKDCWFMACANPLGEVDKEKFKKLLMQNDKPYIHEFFVSAYKEHSTPQGLIGYYVKRIALQQFRELTWSDSIFEAPEQTTTKPTTKKEKPEYDMDELEERWGFGFTDEELVAFEKKFIFLTRTNPPTNEIHIDAIKTYVRYRVKADMATARDDVASASKWGAMAEKQQTIAKLSPDKMTKNDLTGGIDNFATLFKEIENAVDGVIPLLPKYIEKPKDKADFILWCYVNYNRDLRSLPPATHSEIYEFYKRRAEDVVFVDEEEDGENNG